MDAEMNFVRDLALILVSAGMFTIISKALKQPLVLGYIIAGFLIGPNIDFYFGISSVEAVNQWSEIGIIFLMFGLGLEFNFKKLLKVGTGALVTAGCKFLGVFVIGFVAGQAFSWTVMESIFLASLLSMSSTMVVVKSYGEMNLKDKPYAGLVFGTLVVEDLIAVLLMVLLSTLSVSKQFSGSQMLFNLGKLGFFLILWFLIGIYLIPTILKKARKYITDEILLIVSVGLCFGMVFLATAVGFSSALGAFVMGSILAETIEGEHIAKFVKPIEDLFGAIFFVSVGMMLSPAVLAQYWWIIIIIALLVITSHIVFAGFGAILAGNGLENAVHTGFSLAQLGEFGFIIASVGCSMRVMRDFIHPIIIAVSVITIFTSPYMIRLANPAADFLRRKLPSGILSRIDQMSTPSERSTAEQSEWKKLLKAYLMRILLYGVLLTAIFIGFETYLQPLLLKILPGPAAGKGSFLILILEILLMSPFLYGLGVSTGSINAPAMKLLKEKSTNALPIFCLAIIRAFIAIGIILGAISSHVNLAGWAAIAIFFAGVLLLLFSRHYMHKYSALEKHFLSNLNEKEELEKKRTHVTSSIRRKLAGYDVHIDSLTLSPDSGFCGQKLKDIPIRTETGANIVKIQRGSKSIVIPSGDETVYPYDRLLAVGTSSQLSGLKEMFALSVEAENTAERDKQFEVVSVTLSDDSYLNGKTLRSTRMRDYHCMVISVLHGQEFITNPKPDFRFQTNDIVWLAGETNSCNWLK